MTQNAVNPFFKAWEANGVYPAIGYKLYTYESGTTTPKATYSDSALSVPNTNPIILNAKGQATIFLKPDGPYKLVLKTPGDALEETFDPYEQETINALSVDSITALRLLPVLGNTWINVLGYYVPGDGGGGLFYYDPIAIGTDNNGTRILPLGNVGRWLRLNNLSYLTPRFFGAKGDSTADDTTSITKTRDALVAVGGGAMVIGKGNYLITSDITFPSNVYVTLDFQAMLIAGSVKTITFNGKVEGTPTRHFESDTPPVFASGSIQYAFPEWLYTGSGSWHEAINAIVQCVVTGDVYLSGIDRLFDGTYVPKTGVNLIGPGLFMLKNSGGVLIDSIMDTENFPLHLSRLSVGAASELNSGIVVSDAELAATANINHHAIRIPDITGATGTGKNYALKTGKGWLNLGDLLSLSIYQFYNTDVFIGDIVNKQVLIQAGTMSAPRGIGFPNANSVPAGTFYVIFDKSGTVGAVNTLTLQCVSPHEFRYRGFQTTYYTMIYPGQAVIFMSDGLNTWTAVAEVRN